MGEFSWIGQFVQEKLSTLPTSEFVCHREGTDAAGKSEVVHREKQLVVLTHYTEIFKNQQELGI